MLIQDGCKRRIAREDVVDLELNFFIDFAYSLSLLPCTSSNLQNTHLVRTDIPQYYTKNSTWSALAMIVFSNDSL